MTLHMRSSAFAPASYDPATRRIEAILSTFADVQRRDARGAFVERLDPAGLDMSGLAGSPLLNAHRQGDARDVVGVIEGARLEGGKLLATIRLSEAPDAQGVVTRIAEGSLRGVSVGYRVSQWRETTEGGQRIRTAVRWAISEASAVPIPADQQSRFRSKGEAQMEPETEVLDPPATMSDADAQRIRSLGELADLPPSFSEALITRNATVDESRAAVRDELRRRSAEAPRIRVVSNAPNDNPEVVLRNRVDALSTRVCGGDMPEAARPFAHDRLVDHARSSVERTGVSTRGMSADEVFTRAMHGTSDFPMLLQGVGNRSLLPAYQASESPLKKIARRSTATDFRAKSLLRLSDMGPLQKLTEHGEITHATRSETTEGYRLETFARLFALSRVALVNDDLSAFASFNQAAGRAAATTEADALWALLSANARRGVKMNDGVSLFNATHKNLKATAGFTLPAKGEEALALVKAAMARQVDSTGNAISVRPKFIVVSPENEDAVQKLLSAVYAATTADVNPNVGRYEVVSDPHMTTNDALFFSDPSQLAALEYAYLASAPGPQLATRQGWETLGTEWRIHLDFGCGAIEHRAAFLIADTATP